MDCGHRRRSKTETARRTLWIERALHGVFAQWTVVCLRFNGSRKQDGGLCPALPPSSNARYQISTEGGVTPVWSPDGKQLFYGDMRTGRIIAVDINTEPTFSIGKPVALPIERAAIIGNYPGRNFDITPDGKQFIVVMPVASATDTSRRINVVVNWLEELKQRVPVK